MHWRRIVIHSLMLIIIFLVSAIMVNPLTDGIKNDTIRVVVKEFIRIGFTIGMFWLYARMLLKKSSAYFRIHKPFKTSIIWVFVGLAMPLTVIVFYVLTQFVVFEKQEQLSLETALSIIIGAIITAFSAGVIEELLFRGYLFKLIEDKWNVVSAVCVTAIVFSALHLLTVSGLQLVDVCLVLIAVSLVGIMLSLIVYKTGNVWNSVVVHIIWNFFMNPKMVQFAPQEGRSHSSLVMLQFKSDSIWITGGTFGIEVALPVVVLYVLIIAGLGFCKTGVRNNSITY
ncbi:CPBP family intramembrane glutamic endopeptidase [Aeribacillus pallidus]|uniref:CPBP family intramembrane glutamic endopeptidase n=1 Tax=Aeribacillus pallidus TaxID=33936 RepID=UPI001DE126B2|nr:CPBP family intramembrane metalloprotease [Bacillus sp. (in: firmicutes)]